MQETEVQFLGQKDSLEKEMATHSSIFAWEIHDQKSLAGYIHGIAESDTVSDKISHGITKSWT